MRETVTTTFYNRPEWKALRYEVLREDGAKCVGCNSGRESGAVLHVDHIRPRSVFPELALERSNLQILCADCNLGKSNKYADDFRKPPERWTKLRHKSVFRYFGWTGAVAHRYLRILKISMASATGARADMLAAQYATTSDFIKSLASGKTKEEVAADWAKIDAEENTPPSRADKIRIHSFFLRGACE